MLTVRLATLLRASGCLLLLLGGSSEVCGQPPESRAERWKALRLEKARNTVPEQLSGFEKALLRLEEGDFFEVSFRDFYPKLTSISKNSGFSPGVRYWKPELGGSGLELQASAAVSFRNYQLFDLQFGRVLKIEPQPFVQPSGQVGFRELGTRSPQRFYLYGDLRYRDFPQEDFFGVGPASLESDRTDYGLQDASFDVVSGYRFNSWLSGIVRAGFLNARVRRGTDDRFPDVRDFFDEAQAPGLLTGPDFLRFSAAVFADRRDRPGNPHAGGIVSFSVSRFQQRGGNAFDFNRYEVDIREYLPLGSPQRVLALHLFASLDVADEGARTPFFLQNTLGGKDALRGFREFRFRDVNLLYLSAEYRWEAAPALEFALFWDLGKVFADRDRFDLQDLEKAYGAGVRFKTSRNVLFRFEVSRSPEGTRSALTFGPSF